MNISVVTPNFNGENLIRKNLPKVLHALSQLKETRVRVNELILVDDASTDGSVAEISEQIKNNSTNIKIIMLENSKNLGFSSTVNRGVSKTTGDVVVLLNTDVHPEDGFLDAALPHFSDENMFAVGFLDKSIEGKQVIKRGRGIGFWHKGFILHGRGDVDKTDTFWVSCGSAVFRRQIWNRLGGLDELYNPFYWEDIDLSYRAQKSGYKILFEPKSIVVHEHEKGSIQSHFSKKQVTTIAYRNQFYMVWKNITDVSFLWSHIFWLPTHMLRALLSSDGLFFSALLQAGTHIPPIILRRIKQKRLYKKSDRELLMAVPKEG